MYELVIVLVRLLFEIEQNSFEYFNYLLIISLYY